MSKDRVTQEEIQNAVLTLKLRLEQQLQNKGDKKFSSPHESLGVITEEYYELIEAIKDNSLEATRHEFLDLAIAALFGFISTEK